VVVVGMRFGGEQMSANEPLVGNREVARFLRVPERAIARLVRDEGLPLAKVGWFHMSTPRLLIEWVEEKARRRGDG
jgi:hypothetical protein